MLGRQRVSAAPAADEPVPLQVFTRPSSCFQPRMDQYFTQMEKIVKERKTSSRIRFMLQDIIDLRLVSAPVPSAAAAASCCRL